MKPKFKLHKCSARVADGKYSASVLRGHVYDTEQVVQEAIDHCGFHLSPYIFESVVAGLFESMMYHTMQDGATRRFGDYFEIQLDVKGTFDSPDAQFDNSRNKVKFSLRPLKKLRRKVESEMPENRVKPPRAHIEVVKSESGGDNEVVAGEDIVIRGRNLLLFGSSSGLTFHYEQEDGTPVNATFPASSLLENTPERLSIAYGEVFGRVPISSANRWFSVSIRSEGGREGGASRRVNYAQMVEVLPERAE